MRDFNMELFSSWGADVGFWLSDAPTKINVPNPHLVRGNSKTCVALEWANN